MGGGQLSALFLKVKGECTCDAREARVARQREARVGPSRGKRVMRVRCAGSACAGNPEWHHLLAAHTGNTSPLVLCCHGVKRIIF